MYDSVNKRLSVLDVIEKLIPNDYDIREEGSGWMRLNPCPFTGSTKDAFAVHEIEGGMQMYQLWSSNFLDDRYCDLPEAGTAAHIVQVLFDNEIDVLKLLQGQQPRINTAIEHRQVSEKIKPHQDLWKLSLRHQRYREEVKYHLKYLREVRGLTDATIDHFEIGYDANKYIYTYPYIENGRVVHFKFKGKDRVWNLAENSGGDYLFNSRDLDQDHVLFVEGEHDVCSIWQRYGIEAVGISGNFGEGSAKHKRVIEGSKGKDVWLCFDDDDAGRKYTENFISWLNRVANSVSLIGHTGEGKDPDEWIRSGGDLLFPC
jgi:hypothetical protein